MKKIIAIILGIIWAGFTAVCLFVCLVAGPSPDAGIVYLISAVGISVLLPAAIVCVFFYAVYLEDKLKNLKEEKYNEEDTL